MRLYGMENTEDNKIASIGRSNSVGSSQPFIIDETMKYEKDKNRDNNKDKNNNKKNNNNNNNDDRMKMIDIFNEYSLNKNCFNPSKGSSPNMFIKKLRTRMNTYYRLLEQKQR